MRRNNGLQGTGFFCAAYFFSISFAFVQPLRADQPADSLLPIAIEHENFESPYLKNHIRICNGTKPPKDESKLLLPLMAGNRANFKGKTVLNIDAGAGLLALYAAQLGASKVLATDEGPNAVACAEENARRLGLGGTVHARLIRADDPDSFFGASPSENFDVIIAAPFDWVNRIPRVVSGSVEEGVPPNDSIRWGFTLIAGLQKRLKRGGVAVLLYRSAVLHKLMVNYARHLGYAVAHYPGLSIQDSDWCALYNSYALKVAHDESIDPAVLMLPPSCSTEARHYVKIDWEEQEVLLPRLWDERFKKILPGVIVIGRKGARLHSAATEADDPASLEEP